MHVSKMNVRGSGLIGLYIVATESVVLVGNEVPESKDKLIQEIFKVPIVRTTIAGTSLVGAFVATDGYELLVPGIIFEHEERKLKAAGVKYTKLNTNFTCLGNNVAATKKGVLIHPEFEKEVEEVIGQVFNKNIKRFEIAGNPTVGSFIAHNQTKGLVTSEISDEDAEIIENHLGIELTGGTVEMGSSQVRSAIAVNNNGYIIGEYSGGPELVNADRAFGYSE